MNVIYIAIVVVAGYLLGSLSISILLSKNLLGRDVRRHGSGNAGATNMARVFGMCAGLLTLAGDMLKAAAAMLIGFWLLGDTGMALGWRRVPAWALLPGAARLQGRQGRIVGRNGRADDRLARIPVRCCRISDRGVPYEKGLVRQHMRGADDIHKRGGARCIDSAADTGGDRNADCHRAASR